jgi:hypothetical protein
MFAPPIAGGVEDGRRRCETSKRPVVANICPYAAGGTLPLGEDRDGGIVAVQSLGRKHMGFDEIEQWLDGSADVTNLVGERLGGQIDPLTAKAATCASCSASSAAWALARSSGKESGGSDMPTLEHIYSTNSMQDALKPVSDAKFPEGLASQFRTANNKAGPA